VSVIRLDRTDIVRHALVQAIVDAYESAEPTAAAFPCVEIAAPDHAPITSVPARE
jgi:hypothetical protein